MSTKIKRTTLTNKQKLLVLKYKDSKSNATHINVTQWVKTTFNLDINPTTVGHLLEQNDIKECENVSNTKRSRAVQYPDLENAMYEWVIQYTVSNSSFLTTESRYVRITKMVRNLQVTSFQQTNLELFFNSNALDKVFQ